jgi:hypothetical protein
VLACVGGRASGASLTASAVAGNALGAASLVAGRAREVARASRARCDAVRRRGARIATGESAADARLGNDAMISADFLTGDATIARINRDDDVAGGAVTMA